MNRDWKSYLLCKLVKEKLNNYFYNRRRMNTLSFLNLGAGEII
ncbi:hypothetical protein EZS27_029367, partial [termite gut metagenome]